MVYVGILTVAQLFANNFQLESLTQMWENTQGKNNSG